MNKGYMTRTRTQRLVDLLRQNFMLQTPQVVFLRPDDEEPDHVILKMRTGAYKEMLKTIIAAGGWTLSPEQRRQVLELHEKKARRAHGDGVTYDLEGLSQGDLVSMHEETGKIPELAAFNTALGAELERRSREARGEVTQADA